MFTAHSNDFELEEALQVVSTLNHIFNELGSPITPESRVLDFGCGQAKIVLAYRQLGYPAFGTDIHPKFYKALAFLEKNSLCTSEEQPLRQIAFANYKIPFESDFFDYVISTSVFEHVHNLPEVLTEIKRVLKPGGKSLHLFPSKYRLVERHTFVPLAGIFQAYNYLYFWALVGIRNSFQSGMSPKNCTISNVHYLAASTNYNSKKKLIKLLNSSFVNIKFVEEYLWKCGKGRGNYLWQLIKKLQMEIAFPMVCSFLSIFGTRALYFEKFKNSTGLRLDQS